jgi:hypothetical protein
MTAMSESMDGTPAFSDGTCGFCLESSKWLLRMMGAGCRCGCGEEPIDVMG